MEAPETLLDKIWRSHAVETRDGDTLLLIDRHFTHEGAMRAFEILEERSLDVAHPERTVGVADHYVPTDPDRLSTLDARRAKILERFEGGLRARGVLALGMADPRQGIVHVVGPEQGLTLPGMTLVCGDSHTATQGAMGALAFGIGASEVAQVFAAQALWLRKPKALRAQVDGRLAPGVSAKDLTLALVRRIGAGGGVGHIIEYQGEAIEALSIEERLTLCNMAIEAGARSGLVAPDETTIAYLRDRPFAPAGDQFERAVQAWRALRPDPAARYDHEVRVDAGTLAPMVTWGTSPEDAVAINEPVPIKASSASLDYMQIAAGRPLEGLAIDQVFIGSCTNSRLSDLRAAAALLRGRSVAAGVKAVVVPGSGPIRREAEAEGLDKVFLAAGFEWREPGCSMCVGMNGDIAAPGQRVASTSNRNFPGRQGPGVRTHLVSPTMAAAAAVTGRLTDARKLMS